MKIPSLETSSSQNEHDFDDLNDKCKDDEIKASRPLKWN